MPRRTTFRVVSRGEFNQGDPEVTPYAPRRDNATPDSFASAREACNNRRQWTRVARETATRVLMGSFESTMGVPR
jgi:hypothetical protein